jgi:hypothetical protein
MIFRFCLFMVSQKSCMFLAHFLSVFLWSFTVWSYFSTLSSTPDTLFSTWSTLFVKLSINTLFGILIYLFNIDYFSVFPYLYGFPF